MTLTHLLLLLESLLSVMSSYVFPFLVVYTEEIGHLVHGFTCIINGGHESVMQLNAIRML